MKWSANWLCRCFSNRDKLVLCLALFSLGLSSSWAQESSSGRSGIPAIDTLPTDDWAVETGELSYSKALLYSLLFPGGGQFYSKRNTQGGFLVFLETALLLDGFIFRQQLIDLKHKQSQQFLTYSRDLFIQSLSDPNPSTLLDDRKSAIVQARVFQDTKMMARDLQKSEISWAIGLHFYGVLDAMEIVYQSRKQEPLKLSSQGALWRGLVFPGWGQLYNRKFGKFGMLWMAMGNSIASSIYRQEMVRYFQGRLDNSKEESIGSGEIARLEQLTTQYRKSRNQYLWALGLLYLYALGDGVVDAILEDFDSPERYAYLPQILPGKHPFSWELVFRF